MLVDSTMENWFFLKNSHSDPLQCIWLHLMDDSKCKQGCAFLCLMPILKAGIQLGQWEQFWLDFYLSCWKIPRLKAQSKLRKKQRENMLWNVDSHQFNLSDQVFVELFSGNQSSYSLISGLIWPVLGVKCLLQNSKWVKVCYEALLFHEISMKNS